MLRRVFLLKGDSELGAKLFAVAQQRVANLPYGGAAVAHGAPVR